MYETAIAFITDSYRTTLCLQFLPNQMLYGAILMAAIQLSLQPTSTNTKITLEQSWFDVLERERDIDEASMKNICFQLMDLYDGEDTSLRCAIKDRNAALRNIQQIVGGETSDTSKPSPTGVVTSDGEVPSSSSSTTADKITKPNHNNVNNSNNIGLNTISSYDNLYNSQLQQQELEGKQQRSKSITVTSFLKPQHPRSGSLGNAPHSTEQSPTAQQSVDYSSDHSTFSEANRELSHTPGHSYSQLPATPVIESTPYTSYPCTPNFDSCPPPAAMREQNYQYTVDSKVNNIGSSSNSTSNNIASTSNDFNEDSAPKRARFE